MWTVNAPRAPNGNGPNIAANTRPCEYRYTTHPPTSLRSPDPPSRLHYDQGTRIWARKSVNLRFVVHIPSPNPVISRARTCVRDVLLENSPVIGIHQKSAKYREPLLLYSLTFAGMRVSVGHEYISRRLCRRKLYGFLKTFIFTIIFCTLKINIYNLFVNLFSILGSIMYSHSM